MKLKKEVPVLVRNKKRDIETSNVPDLKTLQSSESHTDVTVYDFSDQWGRILYQDTRKLNKTTQEFVCSAALPLDRRYHMYRVLTTKTLQGQLLCDTMKGRSKSMDDNQYDHVFENKD